MVSSLGDARALVLAKRHQPGRDFGDDPHLGLRLERARELDAFVEIARGGHRGSHRQDGCLRRHRRRRLTVARREGEEDHGWVRS